MAFNFQSLQRTLPPNLSAQAPVHTVGEMFLRTTSKEYKNKTNTISPDLERRLVAQHLPNVQEALGSNPSPGKEKKRRTQFHSFLVFGRTGNWTQSLVHAGQELYHLSTPQPFGFVFCFWERVSIWLIPGSVCCCPSFHSLHWFQTQRWEGIYWRRQHFFR